MENGDYLQLVESIVTSLKEAIQNDEYHLEERLPTAIQLAREFDAALNVVQLALDKLVQEGIILELHGVGHFIQPKPLFTAGIEELQSVSGMIRKAGMEPGTIFIDMIEIDSNSDQTLPFQRAEDEKVLIIKRIRTANNQPVVFCIDYVLTKTISITSDELLHTSIFEAIERSGNIYIEQAIANIEPIAYDEEASSYLRCGIDVSLLALEQQHFDRDGNMVLYSKNFFRADKFKFHVLRKRV